MPDTTTVITRGKNGEQVKTEITNILGKTETIIDHTTNIVTMKTKSGQNITYQPDGSFTVNGSKTVIDFKVNADGVTTLQSYSKEGWLKKPTVSEAIANVGAQPPGKILGKFGNQKPVMEQLPDGSTKITTKAKDSNETVMAEVIIDPQGKVTYRRKNILNTDPNKDPLTIVAETKPQADGSFELSVLKPDNTYSTRVVANDGSIAKKWVKTDGSTVTSLNNGPDITTKNSGNKLESSITNKDGWTTTIVNNNDEYDYTLEISSGGDKNSTSKIVDLKTNMNQLLDNQNSKFADQVDAIAVKILKNNQILNSVEYKNIKNKIVKEAESQRDAQFSQDKSAVAASNKQYFTKVWQDIISLTGKKPEGFIEG